MLILSEYKDIYDHLAHIYGVDNNVVYNRPYYTIIDDKDAKTVFFLKNLAIHNMGGDNIHVIINGGDEILIRGNEVMTCGEIKVYSLVVVETGSNVRYMGIEG